MDGGTAGKGSVMVKTSHRSSRATPARRRAVAIPPHLGHSPATWRTLKRRQRRDVRWALAGFAYGGAYVPAQAKLLQLQQLAEQIEAALDADGWIAW